MKALFASAAVALALTGGVAQAQAGDAAVCSVVADIAGNAATMRQSGYTQQETARAGADYFSKVVNSAEFRRAYSNEQRRALAKAWGATATHIVQVVYSHPIAKTESGKRAEVAAAAKGAFIGCLRAM